MKSAKIDAIYERVRAVEVEEACRRGEHDWDIVAIGRGIADFVCMNCRAESHGSNEPLKKFGFVALDDGRIVRQPQEKP